ncbi:sulfatase-like hydrolase/transferase, partial [bacterium]|nr:sulfatase-like hydrolase/transferase [bacterium]
GRAAKRHGKRVSLFQAGFKSGKGSPYEGGTHVPAFWRWKGKLGQGIDIPALTAHIDLFKTMVEICGASIPLDIQPLDGRSLVPLLEDSKADWQDRHLFVHQGRWGKGVDPATAKFKQCAVRTARWRFVNNKELYDISMDPFETTDLASDFPEVLTQLRKTYDQWWAATLPFMVNEKVPYSEEHPQAIRYDRQLKERGIPRWKPLPF